MKRKIFLSVLQFQLKLNLESNFKEEYLLEDDMYFKQMEEAIKVIKKYSPDVVVFPEMSYSVKYADELIKLSKGRLIVFGSKYINGNNTTVIYHDLKEYLVIKRFPSGAEPMIRNYKGMDKNEFIEKYLEEHTFVVNDQKIIIFNCMEYYNMAYYIARDNKYNQGLFGFVVTCSNSNSNVFIQESMAIHNHNDKIYSFVCNTLSKYNAKNYGDGNSYVFGPSQNHEKEWLGEQKILNNNHVSSIVNIGSKGKKYLYGEYLIPDLINRFGRSDFYLNTPQNIKIDFLK